MDYTRTKKDELIRLLKKAQKNETTLAVKLRRSEASHLDTHNEKEMYRAKIADLEERYDNVCRINKSMKGDNDVLRSEADTGKSLHLNLQKQIADLESQLAAEKEISKAAMSARYSAEVVEKVDGVFAVGDRVVGKPTGRFGTVESLRDTERGLQLRGRYDCGAILRDNVKYFRHATPSAPTCRECAAKQKRVDELSHKYEVERDRANDLLMDRDEAAARHDDYKTGTTAHRESLEEKLDNHAATIDSQSALIADMDTALTRKNYTILQLSDQVAALEMGD